MFKHWGMCSSSGKVLNDLISMKRKTTWGVGEWLNILECVHRKRNFWMILSRWREKGHRMLVNHRTLVNVTVLREIVQWSHLDEKKKDIRCCWMPKNCCSMMFCMLFGIYCVCCICWCIVFVLCMSVFVAECGFWLFIGDRMAVELGVREICFRWRMGWDGEFVCVFSGIDSCQFP